MNPKDVEELRRELGYYPLNLEDYNPDNWEDYIWDYIEKLEQEVIRLREQLLEVRKGYAQSIEAREGGIKWPTP